MDEGVVAQACIVNTPKQDCISTIPYRMKGRKLVLLFIWCAGFPLQPLSKYYIPLVPHYWPHLLLGNFHALNKNW